MGGAITNRDAAARCRRRHVVIAAAAVAVLMMMAAITITAAAPTVVTPICQRVGCDCYITADYWVRANCTFGGQQAVDIVADSLPIALLELELVGGQEITVHEGVFARLHSLQRVRVRNVPRLRVRRHAFNQLQSKQTLVEVVDCGAVVLESGAMRGVAGPLVVLVARCSHVIVQATAFSWLLAVTVKDVPRLELAEKAFSFEKPRSASGSNHGPATTVLLQNVIVAELPPLTFPTPAAELRLIDVEVRAVRRDAFCALHLSSVIVQNSSLHRIEAGAFCERTLIQELQLVGVRVRTIEAGAFLGAIQQFTIQHSRFQEVVGGAVNITVASVTLRENVFEKIRTRGFVFKSWNRISVDANLFQWAEPEALSAQFDHLYGSNNMFGFTHNEIADFRPGAFSIATQALEVPAGLAAHVYDNQFTQGCRCNLPAWIRDTVTLEKGSQETVEWFFNTSFCTVNSLLAKCFNVPQGFVNMRNFTDIVCGASQVIVCDEVSQSKIAISVVQNVNSFSPTDSDIENELAREKKILAVIFFVVVSCMAMIVMVTMLMWMKRKGYCVQARIMFLPSTTSCMTVFHRAFESFRGGTGIVAAGSISRMNVREYTEIQQQRQQQRVVMIPIDDIADIDNEFVPLEDKWTQTLPEELTQELLQSLREKLDDPENYSEARDMIEHLYDLIKVEESCSNNNTPSTSETIEVYDDDDLEDNLYDVIQPPISTPAKRSKQCNGKLKKAAMCHVGTRAPSPDKLLPAATYAEIKRTRRPAVVLEYAQPRDQQTHHYTELPGGPPVPPPKPPPVPTSPIPKRGPARPLSFLRVLGESLASPHNETSDSLTCDYSEPHNVSKINVKMANRPLPNKPDLGHDPGEGTSSPGL